MLLQREAVGALGAEAMVLDVAACVLGVRHCWCGRRQIGNVRGRAVELIVVLVFLRLERRDLGLQARDLGHERLRRRFLVAFLRRADLPRRRVAAGERGLRLLDAGAPALVDFDQPLCFRREPTPREPPVEGVGIVTNPLDVVHLQRPSGESAPRYSATAAILPSPCGGSPTGLDRTNKWLIPPAWRRRWRRPWPCRRPRSSPPTAPTRPSLHKVPSAATRGRAG